MPSAPPACYIEGLIPDRVPERRYVIFAEGWFASRHAKTAHGLLRYGKDAVAAVVDSTLVAVVWLGLAVPVGGAVLLDVEISPGV